MHVSEIINNAVRKLGSRTSLAHHLELSTSSVNKWLAEGIIPAKHCIELSRITGVPLHELNPDVFDPDVWILSDDEAALIAELRQEAE